MTGEEIKSIIESRTYPGSGKGTLTETHISWVILTKHYAFKIKKPVAFSFLDFSTLAKRKYFCNRELRLNSRLAKNIYLNVLPVRMYDSKVYIGRKDGKIIDYAVQMKRLLRSREMDRMLEAGKVTPRHIISIARIVAPFHRSARIIRKPFDIAGLKTLFNDIRSVADFIDRRIKKGGREIIREAVHLSDVFLRQHHAAFQQRAKEGFIRDCHGDLHSGNIFLYKKPVIFDCLEFNDTFRHIDVLNEIAFFCMDLEDYGRNDLSDKFREHYNELFPVIRNESDEALFRYYKLYRANVRTKVNALKAMQAASELKLKKRTGFVVSYLQLMKRYLKEVSGI
ncbi:MAG TPA: hypothetical protein VNJ07_14950 [Chitinophagales bacterium]|nr:hypothetical protein [Chitinophagales bacterium]